MALGTVTEGGSGTYLVIAGGFIWNKKADKTDPNYKEQAWKNQRGEEQIRSGAQYKNLSGRITSVWTKTHEQYGEALYVQLIDGNDKYILNIKTNTGNSQQMMKGLLLMDLDKDILISPYDFVTKDTGKRRNGISLKQDGEKIDLTKFDAGAEWKTEKDFWLPSNKKKYQRWLADFSDFLVGEIEEKIVPQLDSKTSNTNQDSDEVISQPIVKKKEELKPVEKDLITTSKTVTPLKMKKFLKDYIAENYEGQELPKLDKDGVITWYNLALEMEELPFPEENDVALAEVDDEDIQSQLDALAG